MRNFQINSNFHIEKATGEYIFGLDADEMPQETLIKGLKKIISESDVDILWIPRINIHPGSTQAFTKKMNFPVNENGWINWPDYQGRVYRNNGKIKWGVEDLHTKLTGGDRSAQLNPSPQIALWHIKATEKQESRWVNGNITSPTDTNLYDLLM